MANVSASKKSIRVTARRTERNKAVKSKVKTYFRKVHDAIKNGIYANARVAFVEFESVLARAVKKGVFKKNTASRKLTRLNKHIRKINAK